MRTNLRARLERLEQAIPKGRIFCVFDGSNLFGGPSLAEREAAFRAQNDVGLRDTIMVVRRRAPA